MVAGASRPEVGPSPTLARSQDCRAAGPAVAAAEVPRGPRLELEPDVAAASQRAEFAPAGGTDVHCAGAAPSAEKNNSCAERAPAAGPSNSGAELAPHAAAGAADGGRRQAGRTVRVLSKPTTEPWDIRRTVPRDVMAQRADLVDEVRGADIQHWVPNCSTMSRAREVPIPGVRHPPRPLRSPDFPEGLPELWDLGRKRPTQGPRRHGDGRLGRGGVLSGTR